MYTRKQPTKILEAWYVFIDEHSYLKSNPQTDVISGWASGLTYSVTRASAWSEENDSGLSQISRLTDTSLEYWIKIYEANHVYKKTSNIDSEASSVHK